MVRRQGREIRRLPSFGVRYHVRRTMRRRQRRAALLIALILHLIGAFFLIQQIRQEIVDDDAIYVEWVEMPKEKRPVVKRQIVRSVEAPATTESVFRRASTVASVRVERDLSAPPPLAVNALENLPVVTDKSDLTGGQAGASSDVQGGTEATRPDGSGSERTIRPSGQGSGFDAFRKEDSGANESSPTTVEHDLLTRVDEAVLGGVLEGTAQEPRGHIRLIRLKHSLSDWWQDPTAIPSFAKWLRENTQLRADMTFAGGSLLLTDDRIHQAPLVIMTGHDKDITVGRALSRGGPLSEGFTATERMALRKYIIERGGMLFFDDCGFNGLFAATIANELRLTFPEYPLTSIPHTHELYTIYYQLPRPPTGGDVFWHSENKAQQSKYKYQKGITIGRRLRVVYNRKDYLCAMETAEIESRTMLRMRRSTDVHRFMTNLLIYTMRYGGNTDRSGYKP